MTQHRRSKTYIEGPIKSCGGYSFDNGEVAFGDILNPVQKNKRKRKDYEKVASSENFEFRRNG